MLFKCLVVGGLFVESYLLYNAIGKAKPDCAVLFSLGVGDIHACVAQPAALSLVRFAEDLLHDSLGFVSVNGIDGFGVYGRRPGKGLTHGFGGDGGCGWGCDRAAGRSAAVARDVAVNVFLIT